MRLTPRPGPGEGEGPCPPGRQAEPLATPGVSAGHSAGRHLAPRSTVEAAAKALATGSAAQPAVTLPDGIWDGPSPERRPLDLIYVLPHHYVTGGVKILHEHVRRLRARGHRVRVAYRGNATRALPPWSDVEADGEIVNPPRQPLGPRLGGADAVVVGWYQQLRECAAASSPLVYFEQGHEVLYEDVPGTPEGRARVAEFERTLRMPVPVAAVSHHVARVLQSRFGRRAGVWPNGIDIVRFRPDGHAPGRRVLLVGNPLLPFKGFATALHALELAWRAAPGFEVTWASQEPVQVSGNPFPLANVVAPPQEELPAIYRSHDLLLFTSRYESFPLPPIEAMASGVPVVATQCGGIATYATSGHDAVLCPVGDVASLARAVVRLLGDPAARRLLSARGRATAERFTWDRALDSVEDTLLRVAARRPLTKEEAR